MGFLVQSFVLVLLLIHFVFCFSAKHDVLVVLAQLVAAAGGAALPADLAALWKVIAAEVPALATMTFANLPETGLVLDATPFAALPFVEGETLHYKPAQPAVAAATA